VRRAEKEITDKQVILEILDKAEICRLGLVENGEAYIVPVNFAHEAGILYIHSAPAGRKMEILRKNNLVTFEIEGPREIIPDKTPCDWTSKYRCLMGRGIVTISDDPVMKKKTLDLLMRKFGAEGPLEYKESSFSKMAALTLSIGSISGKQSGTW
jgi:uncharacterized protein